jgi:hypothetical protein
MKTRSADAQPARALPRFIALLLASVVGCGGAPALAQGGAAPLPPPAAIQPQPAPPPAARWTAEQIRQAFDNADADSNGELSRSEAQRLALLPRSFEDMDQNKDGVLVRAEYEGAFPR